MPRQDMRAKAPRGGTAARPLICVWTFYFACLCDLVLVFACCREFVCVFCAMCWMFGLVFACVVCPVVHFFVFACLVFFLGFACECSRFCVQCSHWQSEFGLSHISQRSVFCVRCSRNLGQCLLCPEWCVPLQAVQRCLGWISGLWKSGVHSLKILASVPLCAVSKMTVLCFCAFLISVNVASKLIPQC